MALYNYRMLPEHKRFDGSMRHLKAQILGHSTLLTDVLQTGIPSHRPLCRNSLFILSSKHQTQDPILTLSTPSNQQPQQPLKGTGLDSAERTAAQETL